jgi:hypothetical protein
VTYVKIGIALALVWFGYKIGVWRIQDEWDADKLKAAQATATAVLTEHTADQAQLAEVTKAEDDHADDLKTLALPSIHTVPVFVYHSPPVCSGTVPSVAAEAPGADPATRPVDRGPGIDLRQRIDAFERTYETALSDCRLLNENWPK